MAHTYKVHGPLVDLIVVLISAFGFYASWCRDQEVRHDPEVENSVWWWGVFWPIFVSLISVTKLLMRIGFDIGIDLPGFFVTSSGCSWIWGCVVLASNFHVLFEEYSWYFATVWGYTIVYPLLVVLFIMTRRENRITVE